MNRRRLLVTLLITVGLAWGLLSAAILAGWKPKLGLDLQGGFAVTLRVPEDSLSGLGPDETQELLEQSVEVMRRRIEELGSVQEPEISVQGSERILVQLPGVQDRDRALQAVGTTGELSFRPVLDSAFGVSVAFLDGTLDPPPNLLPGNGDGESSAAVSPDVIFANLDTGSGLTIVDDPTLPVAYLPGEDGFFYKVGPAFLTGSDIEGARAVLDPGFGAGSPWVVDPTFTSEGGVKFEVATAELSFFPAGSPRRKMAIVVDGVVNSAPQVAEDVLPGAGLDAENVIITLGLDVDPEAEARDLATIIRYGALPTTFERERVETVSASLGTDSLRAGLISGIGGLILVGIALLLYYRALGLVALVGLAVFGSFLILALIVLGRSQGTTLTLAGVTGIIVSIGITSDSYIVFFERVKEECRHGRLLRSAVDHGFSRAFRTILTADFVTAVGSLLLWMLAIGPVRGFAITLGIATFIDVLVAYFFTRPAVMLLVRGRLGEGGPFSIRGSMGRGENENAEQGAGVLA